MSNGSLADFLYKPTWRPDWTQRMRIASDIARGIFYLHEECEAPIIHCDMKSQNILSVSLGLLKFLTLGWRNC